METYQNAEVERFDRLHADMWTIAPNIYLTRFKWYAVEQQHDMLTKLTRFQIELINWPSDWQETRVIHNTDFKSNLILNKRRNMPYRPFVWIIHDWRERKINYSVAQKKNQRDGLISADTFTTATITNNNNNNNNNNSNNHTKEFSILVTAITENWRCKQSDPTLNQHDEHNDPINRFHPTVSWESQWDSLNDPPAIFGPDVDGTAIALAKHMN